MNTIICISYILMIDYIISLCMLLLLLLLLLLGHHLPRRGRLRLHGRPARRLDPRGQVGRGVTGNIYIYIYIYMYIYIYTYILIYLNSLLNKAE